MTRQPSPSNFGARQATCPQGTASSSWSPCRKDEGEAIVVSRPKSARMPCPARQLCTSGRRRQITIRPRELHEAVAAARAEQATAQWKARYAAPAPEGAGPTAAPPARNADSSTAPTTRPAPSPSRPNSSGFCPHQAVWHHPGLGRVFQTSRGGIIQDSAYSAVWAEARKKALTEAQCRSPLGRRPYDLRHAAVSGRGAWSGLRSATAAVPGCRGCARPEVTGRAGAGIGGGAGCSVGVAAAWRADGDLVRASPRLRVSPRQETARAALQKPELTRRHTGVTNVLLCQAGPGQAMARARRSCSQGRCPHRAYITG